MARFYRRSAIDRPDRDGDRVQNPPVLPPKLLDCRHSMRSNVAPFLWLSASLLFAVVWRDQGKGVYLAIAVVLALLALRSYRTTKKSSALTRS
jgi:hypothetical protein